jgi:hypothetical protein
MMAYLEVHDDDDDDDDIKDRIGFTFNFCTVFTKCVFL